MRNKILIAVITCHAFRDRANAQRQTWAKNADGADVRFFLGRGNSEPLADEVHFDVADGYEGLPAKTKAVCRYALDRGYELLVKTDDDSYLSVPRVLKAGYERHDYSGRFRAPSGKYPATYASGFFYCLSPRAMKEIVDAPLTADIAEDRWVGNTLAKSIHKLSIFDDQFRLTIANDKGKPILFFGIDPPTPNNRVIASCEFTPTQMIKVHKRWDSQALMLTSNGSDSLSEVTVLVTSFLRPGYLNTCLAGIRANLPECRVLVVDDSGDDTPADIKLPFDSGLPAKRNAGLRACDTKYLLMGCDDFDFSTKAARDGVVKLLATLQKYAEIDVAGGRFRNEPYEGFLELVPGSHIKETRLIARDNFEFYRVDLTVNYFLARVDRIREFEWDERMKIGGEHFDWFWDLKMAGRTVVWVPGVNIGQLFCQGGERPEYSRYRCRAAELGHRIMLEKRGVNLYCGFDDPPPRGRVQISG